MRSFSWSAAVFDEAHRLKGLHSATRQAVEEMDIGWKLLLTGGSGAVAGVGALLRTKTCGVRVKGTGGVTCARVALGTLHLLLLPCMTLYCTCAHCT